MKKLLFLSLTIFFTLTTKVSSAQSEVTFYTNMGSFVVEVYDTLQPITAGNFLSLVDSKFYDGIIFHRVISNFMIQGGDPTGTGFGGSGTIIQDEFDPSTSNLQKTLVMANSGPNTGTSQFFINLKNNTYLDPKHPVFGIVISNFSVVQTIGGVATNGSNKPLTAVIMDSLRVTKAGPLGIPQVKDKAQNISISPNPTNDNITIDLDKSSVNNNYTLRITNVLNQIVYSKQVNQKRTTINLAANNEKGIYIVSLIDAQQNILNKKKVILQ